MKDYEAYVRDVLIALVAAYPNGRTADEICFDWSFSTPRRVAGLLRSLQSRGLAGYEGGIWWATQAAAEAHHLLSLEPVHGVDPEGGCIGCGAIVKALEPCPTCLGARVTHYAGSMETDDGYCELRSCPTCSTGERLGRSDRPICTEEATDAN